MIEVRYTKTTLQDPAQLARLRQPMAIAAATATVIHDRVVVRGQLATPPKAFATVPDAGNVKKPRYYISPKYAEEAGLGKQTRWESSAAMHQAIGARAGTGDATGALWKGLAVRNSGETAIIEFQGSSYGAKSTLSARRDKIVGAYKVKNTNGRLKAVQMTELRRDEGGDVVYRRKPLQVRNQVKAATVFRNSRIGLLQPTDAETQAQFGAFRDYSANLISSLFGGQPVAGQATGDANLYADILRRMQK